MNSEQLFKKDRLRNSKRFSIQFNVIAYLYWLYLGVEPGLTYLFFQSRPIFAVFTGASISGFVAFFLALSGILGDREQATLFLKVPSIQALILYLLWCGLTLFWTGAPFIPATGYWITLCIKYFIIFRLLSTASYNQQTFISIKGYIRGTLCLALILLFSQEIAEDGRLGHLEFLHPNTVGNQMALAGICNIFMVLQNKYQPQKYLFEIISLIIIAIALFASLSKTAILCFFFAVLAYLILGNFSISKKTLLLCLGASMISLAWAGLSSYLDFYLNEQQGGEALRTLTGRRAIWAMTWRLILDNPILGYGFQSYRYTVQQIIEVRLVHAHNDFFNIWYTVGAIGLILAGLTYLSYIVQLFKASSSKRLEVTLASALCVYSITRGITEASVEDLMTFPTTLLILTSQWIARRESL